MMRLYSWVGSMLATLKASAAPDAVAPRAAMSSALRTRPRMREVSVPAAMTMLERAIEDWLMVPPSWLQTGTDRCRRPVP